ncbi:hypothetical protein AAC978_07475 [Desulfitobacterium sp. THU1]|uniref:hypothetical protein n=1 Tax=Desulfitobacterium sp. THU1 TaxID=3138072 RepID=UPI00311FCA51
MFKIIEFAMDNLLEPDKTDYKEFCSQLNIQIDGLFDLEERDITVFTGQLTRGDVREWDSIKIKSQYGERYATVFRISKGTESIAISVKGEKPTLTL